MSVLERCRFWSHLTSELALHNVGLEPTHLRVSFDIPLAFHDGAKVPDSLKHGASGVINHGVGELVGDELVADGAVSPHTVEEDSATLTDSFDRGSRSAGRLPFCGA